MQKTFRPAGLPITVLSSVLLSFALFVRWPSIRPVLAAHQPATQRQAAATAVVGESIYIVQRGDTLYSLARRFGTTVEILMRLNNIPNPNQIEVEQRLRIPGPTTPGTPTPTPASISVWTPPANAIELFSPVAKGIYHSPIEIIGFSQTFEANVNVRLKDSGGKVLAQRNATGGSVDGFRFFHTYVRFEVTQPVSGLLEVFETSAKDGSEIHKVQIPLVLRPGQRVVDVNTPGVGATVCNPMVMSGYSNTFEATVGVALHQRNGTVIAQTSTQGGNLGIYANFTASFNNAVSTPQPRLVSAYESDAAGLGLIDQTVVPVTVYPAHSGACP